MPEGVDLLGALGVGVLTFNAHEEVWLEFTTRGADHKNAVWEGTQQDLECYMSETARAGGRGVGDNRSPGVVK